MHGRSSKRKSRAATHWRARYHSTSGAPTRISSPIVRRETSDSLLKSATESNQVALGRYKAGVGSILDLLSAQASLALARAQQIQSLYDWHIAKAALAQAIGGLTPERILDATPAP